MGPLLLPFLNPSNLEVQGSLTNTARLPSVQESCLALRKRPSLLRRTGWRGGGARAILRGGRLLLALLLALLLLLAL